MEINQQNPLTSITWRTVRLALRNDRNTFAREHPLSIFDAIFKFSATKLSREILTDWFFHPITPVGPTVRKGQIYELELIFPTTPGNDMQRFLSNIAGWLENPERNFTLVRTEPVRERNLATVWRERQDTLPDGEEACLEFITPLTFSPEDAKRRWDISAPSLGKLMASRVRRLYPDQLDKAWVDATVAAWDRLRTLPWYWDYIQFTHRSKSTGGTQYVNGMTGPLFLRGDIAEALPLLLVCSELHAGRRTAAGMGHFRLAPSRSVVDDLLIDSAPYLRALEELERESDLHPDVQALLEDKEQTVAILQEEILSGTYRCSPVQGHEIPKKSGGSRVIGSYPTRDMLVQRALVSVLGPHLDRTFAETSAGYRPGRSRETARSLVVQALREGCSWVLESDIAAFFDEVDWDILQARLKEVLPRADTVTLSLLMAFVQPEIRLGGQTLSRTRGLVQGSPLSPLLSNVYLDGVDKEMTRQGYRMVRYADDFVVLASSMEEARQAQQTVQVLLSQLKLTLKESKTAIREAWSGFRFLGFDFGGGLDEEAVAEAALRKPLFVRQQYALLGLDGDTLVVRKDGKLLSRLPLARVGEVVVYGSNVFSTRLAAKCAREGIPVSFCSMAGHYEGTLRPESKTWFGRIARHASRHAALDRDESVNIARRLVAAKVANMTHWLRTRLGPGALDLAHKADVTQALLDEISTIDQVRGVEGNFAKAAYPVVNGLVSDPAFTSQRREPHKKPDRYNTLLDFAYTLLFTRLNVLLRGQGLDPFLGVLHSSKDTFESLAADLQEPFRCRMDRLVVGLVNRRVIGADDFEPGRTFGLRLRGEAMGRVLQAFEREMDTRLAGEPGTLKEILAAQVRAVGRWAGGRDFSVFRADLERPGCGFLKPCAPITPVGNRLGADELEEFWEEGQESGVGE